MAQKTKEAIQGPTPSPSRVRVVYFGTSTKMSLCPSDVESLQGRALAKGFSGPWSFSYDPRKYKYLCYPSAWGDVRRFVDTFTKFEVPVEPVYTVKMKSNLGEILPYNVYRSTNMLGGAITVMGY